MTANDTTEFGSILRSRRKVLGYTQAYVTEVTGLSVSFISDLERGKETAELGKVLMLANILGLDCELKVRG